MEFPEGYFEDEIREDFYVSGLMKRVWAANLEVITDVAKVCARHGIRWFADYGTLLGAVRHGGCIPWDDDFDICMLREDYMRFLAVAQKELPENYAVLNCHNQYDDLLTRVVNQTQPCFDEEFLAKYHQCYIATGIDIFPLDHMAPTEKEREAHKKLLQSMLDIRPILQDKELDRTQLNQVLEPLEQMCGVRFDREESLLKQLLEAIEGACMLYSDNKDSDRVMLAYMWAKDGTKTYPLSCFQHAIMVNYEGIDIWISAEYDQMLQIEYGDYMRIIKGGASHDYPCFVPQIEVVKEALPDYPFEYTFDKDDLEPVERLAAGDAAKTRIRGTYTYGEHVSIRIRREVLILPYRASSWKNIEAVWRWERADKTCHVTVILPPYYEKNALGEFVEMHDESGMLPDYVEVTPYDAYDFEHMLPDVIYTQNPYDECNYTTSVHPFFYTRNLRKYTDKLVYIPWFTMRDINVENGKVNQTMRYFCTVPGVVLADEVWLPSKQAKDAYAKKLTAFAGEETETLWEKKLLVREIPVKDRDKEIVYESIPQDWKARIEAADGTKKSIVLYDTSSAPLVQEGTEALQKIEDTLHYFEDRQDTLVLLWRRNPVTERVLEKLRPELFDRYMQLIDGYRASAWGILDEQLSYQQEAALADAYYGDAGYVSRYAETLGKPVMIQKTGIRRDMNGQPCVQMHRDKDGNYPFHIRAYVQVDALLYFIPDEMNLLCSMRLADGVVTIVSSVPEEKVNQTTLALNLEYQDGKLIVIPYMGKTLWVYKVAENIWEKIEIRDQEQGCKFGTSVVYGDMLYLFPTLYNYIVRVDLSREGYNVDYLEDIYRDYRKHSEEEYCQLATAYARVKDVLYFPELRSGLCLRFDLSTENYSWIRIGSADKSFAACAWDGTYFYFVPVTRDALLRWDGKEKFETYALPQSCQYDTWGLVNANVVDGELVLQGYGCDTVVYNLADMVCHTEPVRYSYAWKLREDAYSGYDQATERFVIQDGENRREYTCVFEADTLISYLDQARCSRVVGLTKDAMQEDDAVGIRYLTDCLCDTCMDKQADTGKKTVVFLPYKASMWDSLESIWLAAKEDKRCVAYVVPIPYYDKDAQGNLTTCHYEGEKFPAYVPVTDYRMFDLREAKADIIYIHNPYDEGNYVTSIDPAYYSARLKAYTKKLVYVPYYATSGGMSEAQALCRAYLYADAIIVQAEGHKAYFDPCIPREKLLALGSPKFDRVVRMCKHPAAVPEDWAKKMAGKIVYFFNTSIGGMLADTEAFLKKLRYVFDCFAGREDTCLLWRPHPLLDETFATARSRYKEEYEQLKQAFVDQKLGIYDTTPDIDATIAVSDCYIGDAGTSVTALFGIAGKPVYLLNNYIHREAEAGDAEQEMMTPFYQQGQEAWKITPGNQLYHLEDGVYHYVCDLSRYTSGWYFRLAVEYGEHVYVFPANAQEILMLDADRNITHIALEQKISQPGAFANVWFDGHYAFLIPYKYPYIVRFDMETQGVDYIDGCREFLVAEHEGNVRIGGSGIWNGYLLLTSPVDNRVVAIDCVTMELQVLSVDAKYYRGACGMQADGEQVWLFPSTGTNVVQWNPVTGEAVTYNCRVPEFTCYQYPTGKRCMEHAFGSMMRCENHVILAPLWGNQFVSIDTDMGTVRPFETKINLSYPEDQSYCLSGGAGGFIRRLDEAHALFYDEPERKLYRVNLRDGSAEEVACSFDLTEITAHAPGFAKGSEWMRYGCEERAFYSLPQLLDGTGAGAPFDYAACVAAYGEIAQYAADGSSGKVIHETMLHTLEDIDEK